MATALNRRSKTAMAISISLVALWFIIASFPFLWTFWGSFKVQGDFFSRSDWRNAITGISTVRETGGYFTLNGYFGAWIEGGILARCPQYRDRGSLHRYNLADGWYSWRLCLGALRPSLCLLATNASADLPGDATYHSGLGLSHAVL